MTTEKASPFMAPTLTLCANEKENAPVDESARSGWNDTRQDEIDMQRLGKKQEFNRNFGFMSTLGFVSIYMATWEFVLVSLSAGLINGGLAGLFWMFLGTVLCYSTVVLSLAEMESMAPTSGGQYHWTSEFAPPKYQKLLSYASGWQSSLGWIASTSSAAFVVTTLVEAMIIVERPEFAFLPWQYTLLMLGFLFVTIFLNTWGAKILPGLHTFSLFAHIGGFFITFIALWVMCPRNAPRDVFINVVNSGGWSNTGTSCLISQVTVIYCNIGKWLDYITRLL
jgi:choline transport protein